MADGTNNQDSLSHSFPLVDNEDNRYIYANGVNHEVAFAVFIYSDVVIIMENALHPCVCSGEPMFHMR